MRIALLITFLGSAAGAASLQWAAMPQGRSAPLTVTPGGKPGFTLLAENATAIRFTNALADASVAENQIRLIGSGVALGDVDGDGLCDIYACALERGNALYRNLGNWKFQDITGAAGVGCPRDILKRQVSAIPKHIIGGRHGILIRRKCPTGWRRRTWTTTVTSM